MVLNHLHIQTRAPKRRLARLWQVIVGIFAIALLLAPQQSAAGFTAVDLQSRSGVWIEICGSDGAQLIQLNSDGEEIPVDCPVDCNDHFCCQAMTNKVAPLKATDALNPQERAFSAAQFFTEFTTLPKRPLLQWSLSRGPPLTNIENLMTSLHSYTAKELVMPSRVSLEVS